MEIVIHQELFSALAQAVEQTRPELAAAHTRRYTSKLPFPYNTNKPMEPVKMETTGAELDYDVRASGAGLRITTAGLEIKVAFDAAVMRTRGGQAEEVRFQLPFELKGLFQPSDGTRYPLIVPDASLANLQPPGLRGLFSWVLGEAVSRATKDGGIPVVITLIEKELEAVLAKPVLGNGHVSLTAQLKELS